MRVGVAVAAFPLVDVLGDGLAALPQAASSRRTANRTLKRTNRYLLKARPSSGGCRATARVAPTRTRQSVHFHRLLVGATLAVALHPPEEGRALSKYLSLRFSFLLALLLLLTACGNTALPN